MEVPLCAIYTLCCGVNPCGPLSANMKIYIADLQLTLLARPSSPTGAKKYAYGKA